MPVSDKSTVPAHDRKVLKRKRNGQTKEGPGGSCTGAGTYPEAR